MTAVQHHGLSSTYAPLGSPQDEAIAHMRRCIDFTANLGCEVLVLHPGRGAGISRQSRPLSISFRRNARGHDKERVLECCAENLRMAGRYAQESGVKIASRNVDSFRAGWEYSGPAEACRMTSSPAVGYCLDFGPCPLRGVDVVRWIDIMGDRLFTTHFHDNHGPGAKTVSASGFISAGGLDEHLPPGFGTIPWTDVIAALVRIGYSSPVNFESGAWPGMEPAEGLKAAINYWRTCEHLAEKRLRQANQ